MFFMLHYYFVYVYRVIKYFFYYKYIVASRMRFLFQKFVIMVYLENLSHMKFRNAISIYAGTKFSTELIKMHANLWIFDLHKTKYVTNLYVCFAYTNSL